MRIVSAALLFTAALWVGRGAVADAGGQSDASGGNRPIASKIRLVTLGTTAGPLPRRDRAQSSNLLMVDDTLYLIDAGDNVARRLVQAGADFTRVGRVFITHVHNDHTAGVPNLIAVAWQYNRREPIEFYGPPGTEEMVRAALQFNRVDAEVRLSETHTTSMDELASARNVSAGRVYADRNLTVTAVENTHFQFEPGSPAFGKYTSFAYRFQIANTAIVFTGDTGPSDAVADLAKGADMLVSEALAVDEIRERLLKAGQWQKMSEKERAGWEMHMNQEHLTPEEVGKLAARAGVKLLVMTHLSASGVDNDDYQRFVTRAAKFFPGRIVVAKDLMELTP